VTVVFDTNVWISAAWSETTFCRALLRFSRNRCQFVASAPLLDELEEKLHTKLDWLREDAAKGRRIARRFCRMYCPIKLDAPVCCDADDDVVLATAIAAECEFIVTGDADLLTLGQFQGIKIVQPAEFAEIIGMPRK